MGIILCNGSCTQIHAIAIKPAISYFNTEHETGKILIRLIQPKRGCKGLAGEGTGVND